MMLCAGRLQLARGISYIKHRAPTEKSGKLCQDVTNMTSTTGLVRDLTNLTGLVRMLTILTSLIIFHYYVDQKLQIVHIPDS